MFTLKVDYDGAIPRDFSARVIGIRDALRCRVSRVALRRTRRGYHCTITCIGRATATTVVAAQAIMGSDWRREGFNLGRVRGIRAGTTNAKRGWNVLYERKITVPSWTLGGLAYAKCELTHPVRQRGQRSRSAHDTGRAQSRDALTRHNLR